MKNLWMNSVVVGFALFAMFFGAGNIIFPPYVGMTSGPHWFMAYVCYYIADVGLALVAIFAMLRANCIDRVEGIMFRLGDIPAKIMMAAIVLCLGPLLAVPRTCATTFSMTVAPFLGGTSLWSSVLFAVFFFGITLACSIKESALVDIVGRYLTPLLVIGLLLMIAIGVWHPIGPVADAPKIDNVAWMSISSGYQTMDVLAAFIFGLIVVNALKAKGYTSNKMKFLSVGLAGGIAGLFLLIVYGGLCYLGATVSTLYPQSVDKGQMVLDIAGRIFGGTGSIVLGVVVGLACLTTSVALVGATGTFFSTVTNGKWPYKAVVVVVCVFSAVVANFGLNNIIDFAAPILTIIYPGSLAVMLLSLFDNRIKNDNVFRFTAAGAVLVSFCEVMGWYFPSIFHFVDSLPFDKSGFGWVIPAVLCGLVGAFVKTGQRVDLGEIQDADMEPHHI